MARSLALVAALAGCAVSPAPTEVPPDAPARDLPVDLLFVINVAGFDGGDQGRTIRGSIPALVEGLRDRGVDRIRAAVITSDMGRGAAPDTLGLCSEAGDDGVFLPPWSPTPPSLWPECPGPDRGSVMVVAGSGDVGGFTSSLACRAARGPAALCQSAVLESALKAITSPDAGRIFALGSVGHHGAENVGLVAAGDLLVIVIVTWRDDCTWSEEIVDDGASPVCPSVDGRLPRCCDDVLRPVERYLEGLPDAARRLDAELAVVGILPVQEHFVPPLRADIDYAEILADPLSIPGYGGTGCFAPHASYTSYAAPRLIGLARDLGERATIRSSCPMLSGDVDTFSETMRSTADWIADRARAEP